MQANPTLHGAEPGAKPWHRHLWPWLLMLGPFIVLVAATYTGWLAFTRPDALVVGDYYKRGKAINQDLRRDQAASALGLAVALRYDAAAGMLRGTLSSTEALPPGPVSVQLVHSTRPDLDVRLEAQVSPEGRFTLALPMLERARWQVLVHTPAWRLNGAWDWPRQTGVDIQAAPPSRPADF